MDRFLVFNRLYYALFLPMFVVPFFFFHFTNEIKIVMIRFENGKFWYGINMRQVKRLHNKIEYISNSKSLEIPNSFKLERRKKYIVTVEKIVVINRKNCLNDMWTGYNTPVDMYPTEHKNLWNTRKITFPLEIVLIVTFNFIEITTDELFFQHYRQHLLRINHDYWMIFRRNYCTFSLSNILLLLERQVLLIF